MINQCSECGFEEDGAGFFIKDGKIVCSLCTAHESIAKSAQQGVVLAILCDMVLGEDAPDRSDAALLHGVRKLLEKASSPSQCTTNS